MRIFLNLLTQKEDHGIMLSEKAGYRIREQAWCDLICIEVCVGVWVCVCVSVWEREKGRENVCLEISGKNIQQNVNNAYYLGSRFWKVFLFPLSYIYIYIYIYCVNFVFIMSIYDFYNGGGFIPDAFDFQGKPWTGAGATVKGPPSLPSWGEKRMGGHESTINELGFFF